MKPISPPCRLPRDFGDRIDKLRQEADALGQSDITYTPEMAARMADRRINAQGMRLSVKSEILRPEG